MARQKINQDVFYKSFRYTSKNDLYLDEFLNSLDNRNRFIVSIIKGSKRYQSYIAKIEDEVSTILASNFDDPS